MTTTATSGDLLGVGSHRPCSKIPLGASGRAVSFRTASRGAQYGASKIPLSAKVTNETSGHISGASCLSRDTQSPTDAFSNRAPGVRSTDKKTAPQSGPTGTQGPSKSGNKLQMTFRNPTRLPEGRFSGHERLPASLRGTSTKNRGHNGPRAPQNEP
ncbi:hypothetical protein CRG98_006170 [Punica granatum]|uniref:Uncharacterized protein n=1 Tax=Punica granatum TaxID=22663 RepID=A0A2I0KYJ4_PUNGR|nr:hypothetical protein CRG98_006170 [Punica granatum]